MTPIRLQRPGARDSQMLAAALAGPLAASAVLLPFRASWSNTNAALLLVVVVVAVAAGGNRLAGALAAVSAAVWFEFFFTLPYYRLTIRSSDDVTTALLLLVTGLAVSQLAAWARRLLGELELRVFGNGQYYGRFMMRPRPGARPPLQARLVAVALAEQVGRAYSAAQVLGSAR